MRKAVVRSVAVALAAGMALTGARALQPVRTPLAQLHIDVATHLGAGTETLVPARATTDAPLLGAASRSVLREPPIAPPGAAVVRSLAVSLAAAALRPDTAVDYQVPSALQRGTALPLVAPGTAVEPPVPSGPALPGGVVRHYWGCAAAIPPGQPRHIDAAGMPAEEFERALRVRRTGAAGEAPPGAGAVLELPAEERLVAADASLVGEHALRGTGLPPISFRVERRHEFMAPVLLTIASERRGELQLRWQSLPGARAFFVQAQGAGREAGETVVWSSSLLPEPGFGMFGYLSNLEVDRWLAEGVLLPASLSRCTIAPGVFAPGTAVRVTMIAYGNEFALVQPPRPRDPAVAWEQRWSLRMRFTSTRELLAQVAGDPAAAPTPAAPRRPFETLRGLFGR